MDLTPCPNLPISELSILALPQRRKALLPARVARPSKACRRQVRGGLSLRPRSCGLFERRPRARSAAILKRCSAARAFTVLCWPGGAVSSHFMAATVSVPSNEAAGRSSTRRTGASPSSRSDLQSSRHSSRLTRKSSTSNREWVSFWAATLRPTERVDGRRRRA
jgi:hypothetical protein